MTLPDVFPDIWSGIISFLRSGETESYVGQADLARAARVNSQSRRHLSPSANVLRPRTSCVRLQSCSTLSSSSVIASPQGWIYLDKQMYKGNKRAVRTSKLELLSHVQNLHLVYPPFPSEQGGDLDLRMKMSNDEITLILRTLQYLKLMPHLKSLTLDKADKKRSEKSEPRCEYSPGDQLSRGSATLRQSPTRSIPLPIDCKRSTRSTTRLHAG